MNVTLPRNVRPGSASTVIVAGVPTRTAGASCSKIATSTHNTRASAIWNRLSPALTAPRGTQQQRARHRTAGFQAVDLIERDVPQRETAPGARCERVVLQS